MKKISYFDQKDIFQLPSLQEEQIEEQIWFEKNLVNDVDLVFAHCYDNLEVEKILLKNEIIDKTDLPESEPEFLVVNFKTYKNALGFICRLNYYISEKHEEIKNYIKLFTPCKSCKKLI